MEVIGKCNEFSIFPMTILIFPGKIMLFTESMPNSLKGGCKTPALSCLCCQVETTASLTSDACSQAPKCPQDPLEAFSFVPSGAFLGNSALRNGLFLEAFFKKHKGVVRSAM